MKNVHTEHNTLLSNKHFYSHFTICNIFKLFLVQFEGLIAWIRQRAIEYDVQQASKTQTVKLEGCQSTPRTVSANQIVEHAKNCRSFF